jgi:hypothetical protein
MLTTYAAVANMYLNCIDVRDVADAHVKAMTCEEVCVLFLACMSDLNCRQSDNV